MNLDPETAFHGSQCNGKILNCTSKYTLIDSFHYQYIDILDVYKFAHIFSLLILHKLLNSFHEYG